LNQVALNKSSNELLPVAIWIYGGGFTMGSELVPILYHPKTFTDRGIILVTFNYRLGALGIYDETDPYYLS
jgi:carboxylesterase type B